MKLQPLDFICIVGYLAFVIVLGSLFSGQQKSTRNYFLAGKSMRWLPLAISMYASIFSAISFVMAPAEAFRGDLQYLVALTMFPVASVLALVFFIDLYARLRITTIYEYVEARFNRLLSRIVLSFFLLFRSLYAAIVIFTLSLVLHVAMNFPLVETMIAVGIGAIIYTTLGGMKAVIWTDVAQFVVIVGGLIAALLFASGKVAGGFGEIYGIAKHAGKLRLANLDFDLTQRYIFWTLIPYGFIEFLGAKTVDQMNVQRYMSARNARNAKIALLTQSFFTLPVWLLLFAVGMALFAFYQHNPSPQIAEYVRLGKFDKIFPHYIATVMPVGLRGLLIAALMAAAMSTMDSVLNALSTISVVNIYKKMRPGRPDTHYLKSAKILTIGWGVIVTLLAMLMMDINSILKTINSISGILVGPVLGLFVLGMFTRRSNWQGTLIGLVAALLPLVFMKFGAEMTNAAYHVLGRPDPIPAWIDTLSSLTFTLYGFVGFVICLAVGYLSSRAFPAPNERRIQPLIWRPRPWKDMLLGNPEKTIDINTLLEEETP